MRYFTLLLSLLLFSTCTDDGGDAAGSMAPLEGKWVLEEARRDNVTTGLLDGLYFEFNAGDEFRTNLLGDDQIGTYTRDGVDVATADVAVPLNYTIESLTEEELHLRARYEGFIFDFIMVPE